MRWGMLYTAWCLAHGINMFGEQGEPSSNETTNLHQSTSCVCTLLTMEKSQGAYAAGVAFIHAAQSMLDRRECCSDNIVIMACH